jgi:hypothetical protein
LWVKLFFDRIEAFLELITRISADAVDAGLLKAAGFRLPEPIASRVWQ